jgi:hydrogenase expression/formation protein HypC
VCLGVPGKIIEIFHSDDPIASYAKVDFGGVTREVSLAAVPDAELGEYVVVHAGFALNRLNLEEASRVLSYLDEMQIRQTSER